MNLRDSMIVADFGCGSGGWAIPLAKKLVHGKVFAIDVQSESLSAISGKAKLENIFNIQKIQADLEKGIPVLKNSFFDLILATNLFFQLENKEVILKEAIRVLKSGGKFLVVDWNLGISLGPEKKISSEEIKELAEKAGFRLEKEFEAGEFHYALLFTKT